MRKFSKSLVAVIAFLGVALTSSAQAFEWDVHFQTRFDNREHARTNLATSRTIFGSVLSPTIGVSWGQGSKFMAGIELFAEFGNAEWLHNPTPIAYYNYKDDHFGAYAGIFHRSALKGTYANTIFSSSYTFYNQLIRGTLLQYQGKYGNIELGLDWTGLFNKATTTRECFRVFSAGRFKIPYFYAGYSAQMFHLAKSGTGAKGVVDNIMIIPYVGVDITPAVPLDKFYVQLGWQQSIQRDRTVSKEFQTPFGGELELRLEKWGVGILDIFYYGKNLLPFYGTYGSTLYTCEPYYRAPHGVMNHAELYYTAVKRDGITLKFQLKFKTDGRRMGFEQVANLNIHLNNKQFGQKITFGRKREAVKSDTLTK